jgi:cytoskeletal protein CcmA (bactofilin family)
MMEKRSRLSYLASALVLLMVAAFAFPPSAEAQWIAVGDTIPAGQVVDNDVLLYGNNVVVDGTVHGDVVAVASTVTVNGTIDGSLVTAGRTATIDGTVGGSIYSLARTLELGPSSAVDGNLHFVGLLLDSKPGSKVARDLVVGSIRARVSGEIGRALRALILILTFDGKIGYPVGGELDQPKTDSAPSGAYALPANGTADTGSTLLYVSLGARKIAGYAAPAQVALSPLLLQDEGNEPRLIQGILPEWLVARMGELVTLLIVGALALWLIPAHLSGWEEKLRAKPLPSLGSGVLILIIFANAIGISLLLAVMILFAGIWLGGVSLWSLAFLFWGIAYGMLIIAMSAFTLTVFFGSKVIVAYWAGKGILGRWAPRVAQYRFLLLLLGVVLYILLRSIPTVGWVIEILVVTFGLGAIWVAFRDGRRSAQPVEAESE